MGRLGLALAARYGNINILRTNRNRCGDLGMTVIPSSPIVTVGKPLTILVRLDATFAQPSGWFSLVENGQTLKTAKAANLSAVQFSVSDLPAGTHEMTVTYEGDAQYEPAQSAPFTITVTTESTTTTIHAPAETPYGHVPAISASVIASNGGALTGTLRVSIDGTLVAEGPAPSVSVTSGIPTTVGAHTINAFYVADPAQPPSFTSMTWTIAKQTPGITAANGVAPAGVPGNIDLTITWTGNGVKPAGTLSIGNGSTVYDAEVLSANATSVRLTVPPLPSGTNTLIASFSGDSHYAATSTPVNYVVGPMAGESINARGTADGVTVLWNTTKPILARRTPTGLWSGTCCPAQPFLDVPPIPSSVYLYRMEAADGSATPADVAMRISFTDDPLLPGTIIRAVHLQEILAAANILRESAALAPLDLDFAPGAPITAAAILALRNGINEARAALGAYHYPFSGTVAAGLLVRAADIQELRESVR